MDIFDEYLEDKPQYVTNLSYTDYFGDVAIGKSAIESIKDAWRAEPNSFKIEKRKNTVTYTYPDGGRFYELTRFKDELPPILETKTTGRSLIMRYDIACSIFETDFKKRLFK